MNSVLSDGDKWKEEGIFKNFIAHASFTVLAFPVELYLAARSMQCINAISLSRTDLEVFRYHTVMKTP